MATPTLLSTIPWRVPPATPKHTASTIQARSSGFPAPAAFSTATTRTPPLTTPRPRVLAAQLQRASTMRGLIVGYYYTGGSVQDPTQVAHGFLYNPNDHTYTT